jgi:putative sterol carrier protein
MFKDMLGKAASEEKEPFLKELENHFVPQKEFSATYSILIEGFKNPLSITINNDNLEVIYGKKEEVDVYAKLSIEIMQSIVDGRMTFQRAFMTGEMTAKGNFKTLRMLDQVFLF